MMALSKCKKLLYFISEIVLCVTFVFVIILTSFTLYNLIQFKRFVPLKIFGPPALIMLLNILNTYGFWRGFVGISRDTRYLIVFLCACLTMNVISDVCIGLWTFTIYTDIGTEINDKMDQSFKKYTLKGHQKEEWNNLQYELKCCGTYGPKSFSDIGVDFVPTFCCNSTSPNNNDCIGGFYKDGCISALKVEVNEQIYYFVTLVFIFVIIQILGIVLFCNLNATLNKYQEYPKIASAPAETLPLTSSEK